jgi:hypothetical protein
LLRDNGLQVKNASKIEKTQKNALFFGGSGGRFLACSASFEICLEPDEQAAIQE